MKRSFIALGICAALLCACKLDDGNSSRHDVDRMKSYTREMFSQSVAQPAWVINALVSLDEYMKASPEELQSEEFAWHRENIFHEDETTFMIRELGSVKTYGKSLYDADAEWDHGPGLERTGENSWKFTKSLTDVDVNTTVTFIGEDGTGRNMFNIEVYMTDEYATSRFNDKKIHAVIFTSEGGMTIINPLPKDFSYRGENPEGSGVFRIETETDGEQLDWMELRYYNGKDLVFNCNLTSTRD